MKIVLILITLMFTSFSFSENFKPLEITEIADGVYLHKSFKHFSGYGLVDSNGLIVTNGSKALIIDTPWSEDDTKSLLSWLAEHNYKAVAAVSTHSHEDRTAGIAMLNSNLIPTYTSELTRNFLAEKGQALPTNIFQSDEFSLGNGVVKIFYPGEGHSKDNLVAWLPKKKILFGGCLIRGAGWKSLGNVEDASIEKWAATVKNVQTKYKGMEVVVPGHGLVGDAALLSHTITLAELASNKSKQQGPAGGAR